MLRSVSRVSPLSAAGLLILACGTGLAGPARAEPEPAPATASAAAPTPAAARTRRQEAGVPVAAATVMAAPPPSVFAFSDTVVSYRFQGPSAEPGLRVQRPDGQFVGREVPKNVINLFHANSWAYGTNLLSLDILRSGSQDPIHVERVKKRQIPGALPNGTQRPDEADSGNQSSNDADADENAASQVRRLVAKGDRF